MKPSWFCHRSGRPPQVSPSFASKRNFLRKGLLKVCIKLTQFTVFQLKKCHFWWFSYVIQKPSKVFFFGAWARMMSSTNWVPACESWWPASWVLPNCERFFDRFFSIFNGIFLVMSSGRLRGLSWFLVRKSKALVCSLAFATWLWWSFVELPYAKQGAKRKK